MVVGYLSSTYRDAIAFGILILVLLLRPQGILGRVETGKGVKGPSSLADRRGRASCSP